MTDSGPTVRRISIGAFAIWLLLIAIEYGYIPGLHSTWGFSLLRYLPNWLGWLLAGMALLVTTEEMRRGLVGLARVTARLAGRLSESRRDILLFALAVAFLWLFRERHLFGPSKLLLLLYGADEATTRVPIGAALLLRATLRGATQLGLAPIATAQIVSCLFGASAIVIVTRAARAIGAGSQSGLIPLLVFSGGLLRACVGRIDLQPAVLAAACAALLLALREIRTGDRLRAAAMAVGIAACLQPICFFLLPGLLVVAVLPRRDSSAVARIRCAGYALGWAFAPMLAYAVGVSLVYSSSDAGIVETLATMVGAGGWVRDFGDGTKFGAGYALFSRRHLAYLGSAGFVLAGAALPTLLGFAVGSPRRLYTEPIAAFLAVSCMSLLVGTCLMGPGFGGFEWAKFAVTGLFLTFFAGYLLSRIRAEVVRGQLAAALIGMQFFFVGLPLVCLVFGSTGNAGPFSKDAFKKGAFTKGAFTKGASTKGAFTSWTLAARAPAAGPVTPQP